MPIVRGGYGFGLYNTGDYGTEGSVQDGIALATVSSSATASGLRFKDGSASTSVTSAVQASSTATFASGAIVSSTASTASVGEEFVLKQSDKFSYGTGAYGYNVFDSADLQTIVSATAVSSTASGTRIQSGSATSTASSSVSSIGERIHLGSSEIVSGSGSLADGSFTISASANLSSTCTVTANINRVRFSGAAVSSTTVYNAIGREKWEPIPYNSVTWSEIAA